MDEKVVVVDGRLGIRNIKISVGSGVMIGLDDQKYGDGDLKAVEEK